MNPPEAEIPPWNGPLPDLESERLLLTFPRAEHAPAILAFFERNRERFEPLDPPRPPGFFTEAYWRAQATESEREFVAGRLVRWLLIERRCPARVVGRVNYTAISRGPFQNAILGYQIDQACEGQGLMREALECTLGHVFTQLGLHRVEANHLPTNRRSAGLLRRLGFEPIGLAPNYLFIAGAWRDHVLNQLLNPAAPSPDRDGRSRDPTGSTP